MVAKTALPIALFAWLSACTSKTAPDVPPWLVARPGAMAIFDDEHVPCGPKGRGRPPNSCTTNRIVSIAAVKPHAFEPRADADASDDPFLYAAVTINDSGETRHVQGSHLTFAIPDGTVVYCPKAGWWNPPSEDLYDSSGDTLLQAPVRIRVGKRVMLATEYGDEFFAYQIQVLDGDYAGKRGTSYGFSPTCELDERPGVKLMFHY